MAPPSTAVIQMQDICMRFGQSVVHQDLHLEIRQHEIVSLVGGSGSGKTTLLRQMLGLQKPSSGTVRVFGADIQRADGAQLQALRSRWGMLFQHGALFSSLTAFENVALPLRELRTLPDALIRDAVLLKLGMVGIGPQDALKMPANLSGGMIKRVALARALALEPELLFLDEPTAGLDPDMSETFVALIRSLHKELGLTVVMVTHDLDTLFALSGRIAVLADKHVIINGTPQEVLALRHPFIDHFFQGTRGQRAQETLNDQLKDQPYRSGTNIVGTGSPHPAPLPEGEGENSSPENQTFSGPKQ